MFVGNNASFLNAHRNWQIHNTNIARAIERISTGKKINRAADDAAGLGISERMKAQITALSRQQLNAADELSQADIKDAKFGGMQDLVRDMQDLALQAMNGTISDSDRRRLNEVYQQYVEELTRVSGKQDFKGVSLFSSPASETGGGEEIVLTGKNLDAYMTGLNDYISKVNAAAKNGDNDLLKELGLDRSTGMSDADLLRTAVAKFTREEGQLLLNSDAGEPLSGRDYTVTIRGDRVTVDGQTNSAAYGLGGTDLTTSENAAKALEALNHAAGSIATDRARAGAEQNRLQHLMNSLANMEDNLTTALSRIEDADMAKEIMNYVKESVLSQAAMIAMYYTAQQPKEVLGLLRSLEP